MKSILKDRRVIAIPLVSIIIPVYDVELYLKRCVDSVLEQSYDNIEIILVNDGSPDRCGEICDEYAKFDKRVTVVHKENGGLSDARNAGIARSKGEFITFVDSDDRISRDFVEYLMSLIYGYGADIATCLYSMEYENGALVSEAEKNEEGSVDVLGGTQSLAAALYSRGTSLHATCKLYRRQLFEDVLFPIGKHYEDAGTTYKVMSASKVVTVSSAKKYYYLRRAGSITGAGYNRSMMDLIFFSQEIVEFVESKYPEILTAAKYNSFSGAILVLQAILSGEKSDSSKRDAEKCIEIILEYARVIILDDKAGTQRKVFAFSAIMGRATLLTLLKAKILALKIKTKIRKRA